MSDEKYADLIDDAGAADVSSVRTNALPRAEMLDAAQLFHAARHGLAAAARDAAALAPADDVIDDDAISDSDDGDDGSPPAPAPLVAEPTRISRSKAR